VRCGFIEDAQALFDPIARPNTSLFAHLIFLNQEGPKEMSDAPLERRPISLDVKTIDEVSLRDGAVRVVLRCALLNMPANEGVVLLNLSFDDADILLLQIQKVLASLTISPQKS
jgi:hypothetical protein